MIIRHVIVLAAALLLWHHAGADIAPDITTIEEGFNLVTKLPCLGCPFLYQDSSQGIKSPWARREDPNALLLNISLPYDSAHLTVNGQPLYSGRRNLPRIFAPQLLHDASPTDLAALIATGQLDTIHETNPSAAGGLFGLSYRQSLRSVHTSQGHDALLFGFDVLGLWTDLLEPPQQYDLVAAEQPMLEVLLVRRPLLSALDPAPTFEILETALVPRSQSRLRGVGSGGADRTMRFLEWDDYGRKGTTTHFMASAAVAFMEYIASGLLHLCVFILGTIVLFVVVCLGCVWACGDGPVLRDEYGRAQSGKRRVRKDVERGEGRVRARFKSAEELGLVGKGRVVGIGKGD